MFVPPVYSPVVLLSSFHIPPSVAIDPVHLLLQLSSVCLIPVILVFVEICQCIPYIYPLCTCPLVLMILPDLYKYCRTMRYFQLLGLIESCNLHPICVYTYYSTSFHICHSTLFWHPNLWTLVCMQCKWWILLCCQPLLSFLFFLFLFCCLLMILLLVCHFQFLPSFLLFCCLSSF